MAVSRKMVATTMVWVEGKDGSPEPLGRVLRTRNFSKIMKVAAIRERGIRERSRGLSTFLRDLRLIHW